MGRNSKDKATVVMLNGVGSVGKSSLARALQAVTTDVFLHVQMDAFLAMMPAQYMDHPEGFVFSSSMEDQQRVVSVQSGPVGARVMQGMRHAIAALASQGNNLIVDEVLLGQEKEDYVRLLADFDLLIVGVVAPLDVIEERERNRGDREIGLARWQYQRVHADMKYDLVVDTSVCTPHEAALRIKKEFSL